MQATRPRSLVIAWMTACVALNAAAMGLGAGVGNPMMGQPLNFPVQLRLDPGEVLEPGCVSAEVTVGDRRLPAGMVRTALETSAREVVRVRVQTNVSMDEPVIGVLLTVGCQAKVSRSFVLLADPPLAPAAAVAPVDVASLLPAAAATSNAPGSAAPQLTGGSPQAFTATAAAAASPATSATDGAPAAPAPRAAPRDPAAEARAAARRAERRQARAAARRAAAESARAAAAANPAPAVAPVARLRLDPIEAAPSANPVAVEQALAAVAEAASAARGAAEAASAAALRIATLERTVEQLRGEARASSELNSQLRARLLDADGAGRWTGPLLVALLVLGALAAWLAWRLTELQRLRQSGWREASARASAGGNPAAPRTAPGTLPGATPAGPPSQQMTAPIPFVTSEIMSPPAAPALRPRSAPAWPPPAPSDDEPEPAMQRTEVLPPSLRPDASAARDVSIEELIDLEQQAEFFVVLGQDESAIDLLVDHLRNTGGGSPLPYLKLLEIYRRRGEREAYDRTRSRFNDRFNAYAPDWDTDLQQGRTLDDYPGVIPRLQQVWARPLDAMAELEALLFRKSRGELFELPAYREVLFLYSLARDLLDRESLDSGTVDLLLPLSQGGDYGSTTPHPDFSADADSDRGRSDEVATAPIDLDLTQGEQRSSIFDRLDGERKRQP
jgi:pilus assembly protein FimV